MSMNWSQGGQPSGAVQNNGSNYSSGPPMQSNGPPPICYNCGNEGHFMVACPDPIRSSPAGLAAARASDGTAPDGNGGADGSDAQIPQWANGQKGAVVTRYPVPKNAPVVTRYAVPTKPPQYGNNGGSYGPPAPPYQQYSRSAPPPQAYLPQGPPAQASYPPYPPNQQYGPPGPQYSYNQPQPYSGPPATPQYVNQGYQAPLHNQYPPPNEPQQYSGPIYQNPPRQYGPPHAGPQYQPPGNSYPPQIGGYGDYRRPSAPYQAPPPQWNNTPSIPSSYSAPPYQRQHSNHSQYDGAYQREYSGTPSYQSNPQQVQQQDYGYGSDGYQQTPQTPASNYSNQHGMAQTSQSSPLNIPNESRSSSRASTPYARRGSTSSNTRKGREPETTTPNGKENQEPAKSQDGKDQVDDEEREFNWEFKKIFKEPEKQEWVALAQPLSTTFDMTPVPLLDMRSTNSTSRYARKENLKEFTRSIRSAPQWSYLKEDPAFSDSELDGPLIPFHEIPAWTATRHGTADLPDSRRPSRKRAWSDEQDDVDNQIKLESRHLDPSGEQVDENQQEGEPKTKRQKNEESREKQQSSDASPERSGTPTATASTPVLGRAGTPSFGADDDVWAPQPGEGAESALVDPTEALLASLGVSGAPKPVEEEPFPPFLVSAAEDHFPFPLDPILDKHPPFENPPYPATHSHPNPQYSNEQPINPPYASASRGNPQYGNGPPAPNPTYTNGPYPSPQYSNGPPVYPPYYNASRGNPQYGPPGNIPYANGPSLDPQYSNGPANSQFGCNGDPQYVSGPPVTPQFNHGPHGTPPLRQDSGYVSARGSYSNGSVPNDFNRRRNSQLEGQQQPPSHVKRIDTSVNATSKENISQKMDRNQDSGTEKSESPLSPTSAELLGKLIDPPPKPKKSEPQRQVDDMVRKKRQPVVAEAYSRRW